MNKFYTFAIILILFDVSLIECKKERPDKKNSPAKKKDASEFPSFSGMPTPLSEGSASNYGEEVESPNERPREKKVDTGEEGDEPSVKSAGSTTSANGPNEGAKLSAAAKNGKEKEIKYEEKSASNGAASSRRPFNVFSASAEGARYRSLHNLNSLYRSYIMNGRVLRGDDSDSDAEIIKRLSSMVLESESSTDSPDSSINSYQHRTRNHAGTSSYYDGLNLSSRGSPVYDSDEKERKIKKEKSGESSPAKDAREETSAQEKAKVPKKPHHDKRKKPRESDENKQGSSPKKHSTENKSPKKKHEKHKKHEKSSLPEDQAEQNAPDEPNTPTKVDEKLKKYDKKTSYAREDAENVQQKKTKNKDKKSSQERTSPPHKSSSGRRKSAKVKDNDSELAAGKDKNYSCRTRTSTLSRSSTKSYEGVVKVPSSNTNSDTSIESTARFVKTATATVKKRSDE